jgi:hypothetical protein
MDLKTLASELRVFTIAFGGCPETYTHQHSERAATQFDGSLTYGKNDD